MRAEEIWYGDGWKPAAVRTLLTPLSWLYTLGWQSYLGMYRLGLKRPQEPHRPVLCVGNLVVGGSGKSPLVLHLARLLRNLGQDVVVSASGYGSPRAAGASVAPDGPLDPAEWGDEPAMLRWLQPDLPIVVGRRRVLAAQLVARSWPRSVMLMDDGFQHLPLRKHLTLLLDRDIPNSQTLPAGPYREPRLNQSRADLVLPGAFHVERRALRFVDPEDMSEQPVPVDAVPVCALGRPEGFLADLKEAGISSEGAIVLPDHDSLQAGNLLSRVPPGRAIVTTAKDWVKLRLRPDASSRRFLVALREDRVEPEDEFRTWLQSKLHEIQP